MVQAGARSGLQHLVICYLNKEGSGAADSWWEVVVMFTACSSPGLGSLARQQGLHWRFAPVKDWPGCLVGVSLRGWGLC